MPARRFAGTLALLVAGTSPLVAAPCTVPGTHISLAQALADPSCDPVIVADGDYPAAVTIDRPVQLVGAGPSQTRLLGVPDQNVLGLADPAALQLEGLSLLVHADSLVTQAIVASPGATLSLVDVTIGTAAAVPPPPPLDDAIALWNFVNQVDSLGRESDFVPTGTFSVGNPVSLGPGFAANADGFTGEEGPDGDCGTSWGMIYGPPTSHELALAASGSVSVWARLRFAAFEGTDDVLFFGSVQTATQGTYQLELGSGQAVFAVLGAGQGTETTVVHPSVLSPGAWYDVAGVFDAAQGQIRVEVHDPATGETVGSPATLAAPFPSLALSPDGLILLLLEAPYNANGCNHGGQLEGAAVWNRALSAAEIQQLSLPAGAIFRDGFESGNADAWSAQVP